MAKARADNENLKSEIQALQAELHKEQSSRTAAEDIIEIREADVARLNCELMIANDKVAQLDETKDLAQNLKDGRDGVQSSLNEAIEAFQQKIQFLEDVNTQLQEEKKDMAQKMTEMENNLELKNEHVHDLTKSKYELSGEIATLEELL